jgi:hypothetical protein
MIRRSDLLLVVIAERYGELVVIFRDEVDVAFVLDRWRRIFHSLIDIG